MGKIANKQVICEVLMEAAKTDQDIVALCSDSRGSASFAPFASEYPEQFVETGIAEQNLVSISAGLAKCGKKPYAVSPACFLSTRSYEQCKVDVAYSNTNVKPVSYTHLITSRYCPARKLGIRCPRTRKMPSTQCLLPMAARLMKNC